MRPSGTANVLGCLRPIVSRLPPNCFRSVGSLYVFSTPNRPRRIRGPLMGVSWREPIGFRRAYERHHKHNLGWVGTVVVAFVLAAVTFGAMLLLRRRPTGDWGTDFLLCWAIFLGLVGGLKLLTSLSAYTIQIEK